MPKVSTSLGLVGRIGVSGATKESPIGLSATSSPYEHLVQYFAQEIGTLYLLLTLSYLSSRYSVLVGI